MRNPIVALSLALVLAAGSKKKEEPKPAESPAPAPTAQSGEGEAAAKPAGRPPAMRRQVVPITVEEVQGMFPALEGGRVVKPLGKAERGERVETTLCFDKGEMLQLADTIKGKLTTGGWPTVNIRQHPQITDRVGVNANKPPFVFYGSVQRGPYPDCTKDKNQTLVTLSVHKIETVPGAGPIGPRVPGAPGMRPTIPIRPPTQPPTGTAPQPAPAPAPQKTE